MSERDERPYFRTIPCSTAEQLLETVAAGSDQFEDVRDSEGRGVGAISWFYRGQPDARWRLLPAAMREKSLFPTQRGLKRRGLLTDYRRQVDLEAWALSRFYELSDLQGLPIPEDTQRLRELLEPARLTAHNQIMPSSWPNEELLSLLALAQHYGVPTRLLDWSRDAYTAAYFAARECPS